MLTASCRDIFPFTVCKSLPKPMNRKTDHFGFVHQKGVELFELGRCPQHFFGYVELPCKTVRVPVYPRTCKLWIHATKAHHGI